MSETLAMSSEPCLGYKHVNDDFCYSVVVLKKLQPVTGAIPTLWEGQRATEAGGQDPPATDKEAGAGGGIDKRVP